MVFPIHKKFTTAYALALAFVARTLYKSLWPIETCQKGFADDVFKSANE
jgi:hypothetical protein